MGNRSETARLPVSRKRLWTTHSLNPPRSITEPIQARLDREYSSLKLEAQFRFSFQTEPKKASKQASKKERKKERNRNRQTDRPRMERWENTVGIMCESWAFHDAHCCRCLAFLFLYSLLLDCFSIIIIIIIIILNILLGFGLALLLHFCLEPGKKRVAGHVSTTSYSKSEHMIEDLITSISQSFQFNASYNKLERKPKTRLQELHRWVQLWIRSLLLCVCIRVW